MADDDRLSSALEEIRGNAEDLTASHADEDCRPGAACTGHEAIWMANALDAVLKTAAEWEASSDARPLVPRKYAAEVFRAAITRALLGEEGGDGR